MSCGSLAPVTEDCSGNGFCVLNACICDAGFTGVSDLVGRPAQDCQIHIDAATALWVAVLAVETLLLVINLSVPDWRQPLASMTRSFRERPAFRSIFFHLCTTIPFVALCAYKVAHYPDSLPAIGHDIVATVLYFIGSSLHYVAMVNNIWMWQAIVANSNTALSIADIQGVLRPIKIIGVWACFIVMCNNSLAFLIYGIPDKQEAIGAAFWIVRGLRIAGFGTAELLGVKRLCRLLEATAKVGLPDDMIEQLSPRDRPVATMYRSLRRYIRNGSFAIAIISPVSVLVGAWPFLRTFGSYILPIDLLITSVAKLSVIYAIRFSGVPVAGRSSQTHRLSLNQSPSPRHSVSQAPTWPNPIMTMSGVSSSTSNISLQ